MLRQRIVYIVSDVNKALAFEWIAGQLRSGFELYFILIGERGSALQRFLESQDIRCTVVSDFESPSYGQKFFLILRCLYRIKPHIIHTHLWRANILGLTAGWVLGVKKRVVTRHHAVVHYIEHPRGRKWDRLCNFLATDIVAVSQNVKDVLINMDGAASGKVHLVHHGFDLDYFKNVSQERVSVLREKYGLPAGSSPVIGVIARYIELKGIQFVIPAFKSLLQVHNRAHLLLANTNGEYGPALREQLRSLPPGSFTEIEHESDLAALYRLFDIYVHVPVARESEAFGQTYVEAMACGIPSVFTLSGVAPEFVKDGFNALVVPYQNSEAILSRFLELQSHRDLAGRLVANGRDSIGRFELEGMIQRLVQIYG